MLNHLIEQFDAVALPAFIQQVEEGIEAIRLFDIKLINPQDLWELIGRFFLNLGVTIILIRFLYYPSSKRKDYFFIYMLFSTIIFLLCYLLANVTLQLGIALGLFAIFGIIRYRTDTIPIKEMTYLFLMVGLAVINSLSNKQVSFAEVVFSNIAIIVITWYLEKVWMLKREDFLDIRYEKIELIVPQRREELMNDLKKRTGLDIYRVNINQINFMRDTARIRIFYRHTPYAGSLPKGEEKKIPS